MIKAIITLSNNITITVENYNNTQAENSNVKDCLPPPIPVVSDVQSLKKYLYYYRICKKAEEACNTCMRELYARRQQYLLNLEEMERLEQNGELYSNEGFMDTVKATVKYLLDALIKFIKSIINFIRNLIIKIIDFIKNKIIMRIIKYIQSKLNNCDIGRLYDKYGCLPLNYKNKSTEAKLNEEEVKLQHSLFKRKYSIKSFDRLYTITGFLESSVASMGQSLLDNFDNSFFERFKETYGNTPLNDYYEKYYSDENLEKIIPFYFNVHFMKFIEVLDMMVGTNLKNFIMKKKKDPSIIIELNFNDENIGSIIANAILFNTSYESMKTITNKYQRVTVDDDNVIINEIVEKEVLIRIQKFGANFYDPYMKRLECIKKGLDKFQIISDKIYNYLEEQREQNTTSNKNFMNNLNELYRWINFMIQFTGSLIDGQVTMYKIVYKIITVLKEIDREAAANPHTIKTGEIQTSIGPFHILSPIKDIGKTVKINDIINEEEIISRSEQVMEKTFSRCNFSSVGIPIRLIIIDDFTLLNLNNSTHGFTKWICNVNNQDDRNYTNIYYENLKNSNNTQKIFNRNDTHIINSLNKYRKKENEFQNILISSDISDPIIIMVMNANISTYDKELFKYLHPLTLYLSEVVHESIHAIQYDKIIKNFNSALRSVKGYYNSKNKKYIKDEELRKKYYLESYHRFYLEPAAFKQQLDFILSAVLPENRQIVERILRKENGKFSLNNFYNVLDKLK